MPPQSIDDLRVKVLAAVIGIGSNQPCGCRVDAGSTSQP